MSNQYVMYMQVYEVVISISQVEIGCAVSIIKLSLLICCIH